MPYFVNVGNHEYDAPTAAFSRLGRVRSHYNGSDSGGECGVPTHRQYLAPLAPLDAPWYSFELGPAHVVAMSTEHDFRRGSAQYRWLEADLAAVDKSVTPWILFSGHRPGYIDSDWSSSRHNNGGDVQVMALWIEHVEPLLLAARVQLVFWGHNHQVQRLCAVARGECVQRSAGPSTRTSTRPRPCTWSSARAARRSPTTGAAAGGGRSTSTTSCSTATRIAIDGATTLRWGGRRRPRRGHRHVTITQADPRGGGGGGGARSPLRGGRLVALALLRAWASSSPPWWRAWPRSTVPGGQRPDDQERR